MKLSGFESGEGNFKVDDMVETGRGTDLERGSRALCDQLPRHEVRVVLHHLSGHRHAGPQASQSFSRRVRKTGAGCGRWMMTG